MARRAAMGDDPFHLVDEGRVAKCLGPGLAFEERLNSIEER